MKTGTIKMNRGSEYDSFHYNTGLAYYMAWNELIDNSIDAGATEISFEEGNGSMTITDDGDGIADDEKSMERVIGMYDSPSKGIINKLGEYGIGLKEATMRLGKGIRIKSKAKGYQTIAIDIPWYKLDHDHIDYNTFDNGNQLGTSITIFWDDIILPNAKSFTHYDKLIEEEKLAIYKPNGELYIPQAKPEIKDSKKWPNLSIKGIKFNLEIGLLHDNSITGNTGFNLYPKDKRYLIRRAKSIGKDNVGIADGLYVNVELISGYKLDRNKRNIIGIDLIIDMIDTTAEYLPRWRQKIHNDAKNKTIQDLEDILNALMGFSTDVGQQQRGKGSIKGTIKKVGTARTIKEAESIQPHEQKNVIRRKDNKMNGYSIVEAKFPNETHKYGSINAESGRVVIRLNLNNEFIAETLTKQNDYKRKALLHIIHTWLTAYDLDKERYKDFFGPSIVDCIMLQHKNLDKINK